MARDAKATKARIRAAAVQEFARHGYAGGRVQRIASEAETNVRMIYAYFGGKSGMFDAALSEALTRLARDVPPRPDDLPQWAGDVFDHHQRHPEVLRLTMWAQLERPEALTEPLDVYTAKTRSLATLATEPLSAVDVLVFIYALAQAWQLSPSGLLGLEGNPTAPQRLAQHRTALVTAVTRMLHSTP